VQILYPVFVLSILAAGCRWTGTNVSYTPNELAHHLRTSKTRYLITSQDHLETAEAATRKIDQDVEIIVHSDLLKVDEVWMNSGSGHRMLHELVNVCEPVPLDVRIAKISPDSVASLMSTSGTTGGAKMAEKTHRSLVVESKADELYDQDKPYAIRRLFCTPMFHSYSFPKMVINPLRQGGYSRTYYMPRFDATFAQNIARYGITDTIAVPPILAKLVEEAEDDTVRNHLQTLRCVLCAGAPLLAPLQMAFLALFDEEPCLAQEWGMTECGCVTRIPYGERNKSLSVGRPVGHYQVRLSSDNTAELPNGQTVAELLIRGPQMMDQYLGNKVDTADAFTTDGWYKSGDMGYIAFDGSVHITDRAKDMIKVNGWQVSPTELENVLLELPTVKDCAVFKVGRSVEEHPRVLVIRAGNIEEAELRDHMRSKLSRYKVASCEISFVDSIPRAPSGKVLRHVLRVHAEAQNEAANGTEVTA
jgi:acyl-coenzyme A synthetase/AMP-(fatty) acid ligase